MFRAYARLRLVSVDPSTNRRKPSALSLLLSILPRLRRYPPACISLDLFFLDSDYLVLAEAKSLRPDGSCPEMKEVVGVLEVAAGTIRLS